jgi:ABC-type bacteriocin/lantibiotic exporter with double-glycine peptidase domain
VMISKFSNNSSSALVLVGAFMAAAYKIIPGMVKIINAAGQVKAYEFAINELNENNALSEVMAMPAEPIQIDSIELKDLQFSFGQSQVLNHFNFCLKRGDFIGMAGVSGIGKTTVLNLLTGFLKPPSGELFINHKKQDWACLKNYWPQVSYVRQQAFLFNDSILRNIILNEGDFDKKRLEAVIAVTGLDKLLSGYSEGLELLITENGKNISGGQQQRISLARALYHDASIYLLDEPFNELDEDSETVLLRHFQELSQAGKMVVMVTHNKKALSYCNKIVSLDG